MGALRDAWENIRNTGDQAAEATELRNPPLDHIAKTSGLKLVVLFVVDESSHQDLQSCKRFF